MDKIPVPIMVKFSFVSLNDTGVYFAGSSGFQTTSNWHLLQDFTIEFWVLFDTVAEDPQGVVQAFLVKVGF